MRYLVDTHLAIWSVANSPPLHADPFDRMLVAQAQMEEMTLLTHDHILPQYGPFVLQV